MNESPTINQINQINQIPIQGWYTCTTLNQNTHKIGCLSKTDCLHKSLKCRQRTPKGLPIPPWPQYKGVDPHIATCIHLALENSWHPNTSLSTTYTEEATHPTVIGRRKTLPGTRVAHSSDHVHMSSRLCSGSNTQRHQKQQHKQHANKSWAEACDSTSELTARCGLFLPTFHCPTAMCFQNSCTCGG